ncbi:MAG: ATP-binding protein [Clostridia bacterium]|nr:ATP-binding protein [Clostridia bacterium]
MRQEIINKAISNLINKQKEINASIQQNLEKAFNDKNFCETNKKYKQEMINNARKEANNENVDYSTQTKLEQEIKDILKKLNIESITYKDNCEICHDTFDCNGKMCSCLKSEISNILIQESGFKKLKSFDEAKFDLYQNKEQIQKIFSKMKEWCHNSIINKNLIFISGNTGVGKTFLMQCMAKELIDLGKIVYLTSAFSINQNLFNYRNFSNDSEISLNKYIDPEVLFIDDLGSETLRKNLTIENLYIIINERKIRNLPVIITSNLELSDLREIYGERIYSRIIDRDTSITLKIDGEDLRMKNKK